MLDAKLSLLDVLAVVGGTLLIVLSLLRHRRRVRLQARRRSNRPPMGDGEFLAACGIPDEPLPVKIALATRETIAEWAAVPPETIRPDDPFDHDLLQIPFWKSLDWTGLFLGVEQKLSGRVLVAEPCIDKAARAARRESSDIQVRHVVWALATTVVLPDKETLPEKRHDPPT